MKLLISYARKYWLGILGQLFFATIWVGSQLVIPRLMVDIIDRGIIVGNMNEIGLRGGLMILATIVNIASLLISIYFLTQVNAGIARDLRQDLFAKVIDWSYQTRQKFSNSTLITRTVNDVRQVSSFIDLSLRKIYTLTITVIGSVFLAFSLDPQLALWMFLIIPIVLVLAMYLMKKAIPQYSRIRKAIDAMDRIFRENITGIRVVRTFNKAAYEEDRFEKASKEVYEANVKAESTMMLLSPFIQLVTNILILLILYLGGVRAEAGTLGIGILVAMIEYVTIALLNIQQFAAIITIVPRSQVSIGRIEEVLTSPEELSVSQSHSRLVSNNKISLEMKDIEFYYPKAQRPTLVDINLSLQEGEIQAIIGATGSGKSTIIRLLTRDFDATEGKIYLNGHPIQGLDQEQINDIITVIPQTTFLFSGTIRENIKVGKADASDEEIWQVLELSQMGEFFRNSPEGLDTYIAQNAVNLSGGQKQRISIARGLIRETPFYIFDDCFSAVDYRTERKIRQGIQDKFADKGILVVAQRIATVQDAEQILVLDNGHIVAQGNHQELSRESEIYQEIIASQMKDKEESL